MSGLRIVDVRDDLLRKLGYESAGSAGVGVLADVLQAINYAQQTLWMAGPDYFTRSQIDLELEEDTSAYDLPATVQSVLGPVRLPDGRTLRAIESRSELDNFGLLYLGSNSALLDSGTPLAYFVEGLNQTGDDPVKIKIHVVPPPDSGSAGTAVVEGVSDCKIYASSELAGTTVLPVAQQYVESLFLPIARKAITRSSYFSHTALQPKIDADAELAFALLRRAGGFPPVEGRKESRETEA